MVRERPEGGSSASKRAGSGKKNKAALSAALRANLQRRKARGRALRAAQDAREDTTPQAESNGGAPQTGEAPWIE
jgi:hypothetical protein